MDWKEYIPYFKGFFETLAGKLTAFFSFTLLLIIALSWFGAAIPSEYQLIIYIAVITTIIFSGTVGCIEVLEKEVPDSASVQEKTVTPMAETSQEVLEHKSASEPTPPDPAPKKLDYKSTLDCYMRSIIQDCSTIRLSGLDPNASDPNRQRMSLEKLYIFLDTTTPKVWQKASEGFVKDEGPLSALEALINSRDRRMVLLGLPGTGKSTFVRYLALSMAKAATSTGTLPEGWKTAPLTPFMVSLGRFAETLPKDCQRGRAEMIETYLVQTMKGSEETCAFADFALQTLEREGGLVMFDGLDEVADLKQRPLVAQAVEDFVQKYGRNTATHFLVTCRTYSYLNDAQWKLAGWESHELALLDRIKIEYFVHAWYEELTIIEPGRWEDEYIKKRDDLLKTLQPGDRRHLLDIAAFPIILTIMAVVHTRLGSLPDTRAQVYERCVELLLISWQIEKPIEGKMQKQNILNALQVPQSVLYRALWEVAYKAHSIRNGDEGSLVTEDLLGGVLMVHLKDAQKVGIFLEYCQSANGLLMLQGTVTQSGKEPRRVYAFPHLTFEEYLAGRYLADEDPENYAYPLAGQSDRWRETLKLLGEHLCFSSSQHSAMESLLTALSRPPASATDEECLRLTWLAGDLLVLYRRGFPGKESAVDGKICEKLEKAAVDGNAAPCIRAECADLADELGHQVPDVHAFVLIPNAERPAFMIGRYPVTNAQYARFLQKENFANPQLWINFPKFSEADWNTGQVQRLGDWGNEGWDWLQETLKDKDNPVLDGVLFPRFWNDNRFGVNRPHTPVVVISWWEANAYCRWLLAHWDELDEGKQDLPKPAEIRLPTELEWVMAAGGEEGGRFAWGVLESEDDIIHFANTDEGKIGRTTPVWMYPQGESVPHKLMDISGNVWEWQANNCRNGEERRLRGGSWHYKLLSARVVYRVSSDPNIGFFNYGFRVLGVPVPLA